MMRSAAADNNWVKVVRFDCNYVKSAGGLLKIIETIFSLLVFVFATIAFRNYAAFHDIIRWGWVVGFVCTTVGVALLVARTVSLGGWPRLETVYCACAAFAFLLAGTMLVLVAETAISKPRGGRMLRSSVPDDKFTVAEAQWLLGPITEPFIGPFTYKYNEVPEVIRWIVQIPPTNSDGFKSAVCAAVFSFIATILFIADACFTNTERARPPPTSVYKA